ncbi:sel1 repeat family protein [Pectobacterium versatile]|uniref:tetratricopeptide repeat protein n=1 Tax=Pectobacterium versatile TaxID=2488639 RepID=UPI00196902D7|nr:tetratricopeptide repeat protein [Pectobacterium versatile]MBN3059413.1 sel1 repeat family protein [Pectobacterium versatile]
MNNKSKLTFCIIPMLVSGCSTNYYNSNIQDPIALERQRTIDEGYCTRVATGSVPMLEIRSYQTGVQNYNVVGTARTNYPDGYSTTTNYNSNISSYPNTGEAFTNGLASGASIGAAFRAKLDRDKVLKSCMYTLGWTTDKMVKAEEKTQGERFFSQALEMAKKDDNPEIQARVGYAYMEGKDTKQNIDQAIYWFKKSSERGNKDASLALYVIYSGMFKKEYENKNLMIHYIKNAARQGDGGSQGLLATLYSKGDLVPKDDIQAFEWNKKACSQDDVESCFNLANMFAIGQGTDKSLVAAYVLFNKSARLGKDDAIKQRDYIGSLLNKQKLETAKIAKDIIY